MYSAVHTKYTLRFRRPAGTSRGTLNTKDSWIVRLRRSDDAACFGLGEISLIPGLSPDDPEMIDDLLGSFSESLREKRISPREWLTGAASVPHLSDFPALRFGIETAIRDLETGGNRMLFPSSFTDGTYGIPINGLIWMGDVQHMLEQISRKLNAGFRIIKLKVGALDFQEELEVLETVRSEFTASDLEIRLDANGAWSPADAREKLNRLSAYGIHSLEQPIVAGNHEEMARICEASPIPIALDEELIGVWKPAAMRRLLEVIRPAYIILKPSLVGGKERSKDWIDLSEELGIGWWITSALESNIGLNAIAQWTATLETNMPQGLGTGSLYKNNIPSPLEVLGDRIYYRSGSHWDLSELHFEE